MKKIAFFASHNGSAAKAITKACADGVLEATPVLLITNNTKSAALDWAQDYGVKSHVINDTNTQNVDATIAQMLEESSIDIVVCSGYMKLIGPKTIACVKGRILNVHPALLPLYGGRGMYGRHVHQAVFDNKDKQTGITIHLVDGEYDHGNVIAQKIIPLDSNDGVDDIENKVKAAEPGFYLETLKYILNGQIDLG